MNTNLKPIIISIKLATIFIVVFIVTTGNTITTIENSYEKITPNNIEDIGLLSEYSLQTSNKAFWLSNAGNQLAVYDGQRILILDASFLSIVESFDFPLDTHHTGDEVDDEYETLADAGFISDGTLITGTNIGISAVPDFGNLKLWDIQQNIQSTILDDVAIDNITISHDGRFVAYTRALDNISIMDTVTDEFVATFRVRRRFGGLPTFIPSTNILVFMHYDGLALFNIDTNEERIIRDVPGGLPDDILFTVSPDGEQLAVFNESMVMVWSVDTLEQEGEFNFTESGLIAEVELFGDHTWAAISSSQLENGYVIQVWDYSTGQSIFTIDSQQDTIFDLAINAQETLIASGSRDGAVKIWDLEDNSEILAPLYEFTLGDAIREITFTPNDKFIIIQTYYPALQIWGIQ